MRRATTAAANRLLLDGARALAQVEANGVRVHVKRLYKTMEKTREDIRTLERELRASEEYNIWRKRFGSKAKLTSDDQLAVVLYDELGLPVTARTPSGRPSADVSHIEKTKLPFVEKYILFRKLNKVNGTFLKQTLRELEGEYVHSIYKLDVARTFRSACEAINFQNQPTRDKLMGALIRKVYIPRPGRRIVEVDYSGIEVRGAAFYNHDPVLIAYINDKTKDMHRDMASQLFKIKPSQVTKEARHIGKNKYVFPSFYGDYYCSTARACWEEMLRLDVKTAEGIALQEHLAKKGIKRLGHCDPDKDPQPGTFERHVRDVEDDFWNRRFKVYTEWKKEWYQRYLKHGGFRTLTGFWIDGVFKRNEVINWPIQGTAFHCLLWSLIQLQDELRQRGMGTLIIGQIHDSIVADVVDDELEDYLNLASEIMTERICEHFDFINVPLEVEAEVTPVDGSWHSKAEWECTGKTWREKPKKKAA